MRELLNKYKNAVIWGLVGLIAAMLFLWIGFFQSIFILIIVGIGVFFGLSKDKKVDVKDYFDKIWSKKDWK